LAPIELDRKLVPVNLQIASQPVRVSNDLDDEGHLHRRKDLVKMYQHPPGDFPESQMFERPKFDARAEAVKKYKGDKERNEHIEKTGNIVGVIGQAGIGKTTSMKKWVKRVLNGEMLLRVSFLFFILVRNLDFSKQMNLLEFLVSTVIQDWEHDDETDRKWLKSIYHNKNVLIALDGLDEAAVESLTIKAPKVNLYKPNKPIHFLLNLLSGTLLPFAKVVVSSRPNQLYHLHPDHRPKFVLQILGLDEVGQNDLGHQICLDRYSKVKGILVKNADAFAYCYVPVNFILTVDYLMNFENEVEFVCMTQILASSCERYSVSSHLRSKACNLDKLCHLAWLGFQQIQIIFESEHLELADLDDNTMQAFLTTSVVKSANIKTTIMEGHKRSYFSHLIWQEFFAAMYLMLFASETKFDEALNYLFDDRWEIVSKFLFGLCNYEVYQQLKCVTPAPSDKLRKVKKSKLKNAAIANLEKRYGCQCKDETSEYVDWKELWQICSWIHEANNRDVAMDLVACFPKRIIIPRDTTLLPNDLTNFLYSLQKVQKPPTIAIDQSPFTGELLRRLCASVADSNIIVSIVSVKVFRQLWIG